MKQFTLRRLFQSLVLAGLILLCGIQTGCRKEPPLLQSGGELRFSADTVTFDTVFTTQGSFTVGLKVFNPQSQRISISSVHMESGAASPFHLNVDGIPGPEVKNVEIAGNDSAYIFATVNIDPNSDNSPFLVEDKLVATLNGRDYKVPFRAFGQNAHYVIDSLLEGQITWLTDKPYIIIHSAEVKNGSTLNIPAGCRVYMHADSRLIVDGTLKAIGTKKDSIIFQGDRLDRRYFGFEGYPGEWGGFYFTSHSTGNVLQHVIIRNCGNSALGAVPAAIQVNEDSVKTGIQLYMDRTTVENSIGYGLLSFGGTVKMEHCLIHSCGAYALALVQGGTYELNNCTIAGYGSDKINHSETGTAILLNYFKISDTDIRTGEMKAVLRNSVIYGSLQNELIIDNVTTVPDMVTLDHCIAKADPTKIPSWVQQTATQYNVDPQFTDYRKWNYRPKNQNSPLVDSGTPLPAGSATKDLDDNDRPQNGSWDIGAYEFKP